MYYPSQKLLMSESYISKLLLSNFRNYSSMQIVIPPSKSIIITGNNGTGKTNILEAISLLSPGRGLRNAKFDHLCLHDEERFTVYTEINNPHGLHTVGIERTNNKSTIKINGKMHDKQKDLLDIISVIWFTPQMGLLFTGDKEARRKFFDRIVFMFYKQHAKYISTYEHAKQTRRKLLVSNSSDTYWLNSVEKIMSENAVYAAQGRINVIKHLCNFLDDIALLYIDGHIERFLQDHDTDSTISMCIDKFSRSRTVDRASGRTNFGIHKSDLQAIFKQKDIPASTCSTGEQKVIILSIILSCIQAKQHCHNSTPVVLLDDIIDHLDDLNTKKMLDKIIDTGCQAFITGTHLGNFSHESDNFVVFKTHDNALLAC